MSKICKLCQEESEIDTQTSCCDNCFCFMCLKTYVLENGSKCPICNTDLDFDVNKMECDIKLTKKVLWLYAGNYGWWCYDDKTDVKIEKIYKDYLKRKKILTNEEEPDNSATEDDSTLDSDTDDSQDIKTILKNKSFNLVNFSGTTKHSDSESDNESEDGTVNYIISIGSFKYYLDFEHMKQINNDNPKKQRNIQRIEIDSKITDINKHLIENYNVKGISGVKFSDSTS